MCCDILCCQKCERQRKRERYIRRRRKAMEARQNALALVETKMFTEDETGGNFTYGLPGGQSSDPPIKQDSIQDKPETERDGTKNGETNVCFDICDIDKELPQAVIDNMDKARETDILDSEVESDICQTEILDETKGSEKRNPLKRVQRADSQLSTHSDILSKLPTARETDILTDSVCDGLDNPAMDINEEERAKTNDVQKKAPSNNNPKRRSLFGRFSKKTKKPKLKRQEEIEEKDNVESKSDNKENTNAKSQEETTELDGNSNDKQQEADGADRTNSIKLKSIKDKKTNSSDNSNKDVEEENESKVQNKEVKVKNKTKKKDLERSKHMSLRALKAKSSKRRELEGLDLDSPEMSRKLRKSSLHSSGDSRKRRLNDSDESFATAQSSFAHISQSSFITNGHQCDDDDVVSESGLDNSHHHHSALNRFNSLPADIGNMDEEEGALTIIEQPSNVEYVDLNSYSPDQKCQLDDFSDYVDDSNQKVTVPISVCLVIITAYIFLGSLLFSMWENWDYLTGSYFCFITLSTIGFGDIVPGMGMNEWNSHRKLVLCSLYLAFGLSLLAMCFNLMQEEVKEKCKWLGRKLGLIKESDN